MNFNRRALLPLFVPALLMVAIVATLPLLTGCNTVGCTDNRSAIPLAGFYDSEGKEIYIDSITIGGIGAPGDSLLLDCQRAGAVYLPLRQTKESASFFVAYRQQALDYPELVDTITFNYRSIPYFASEECGALLEYRITRVSHTCHLIDSVAVVPADSLIINVPVENIRLYFRTASPAADD